MFFFETQCSNYGSSMTLPAEAKIGGPCRCEWGGSAGSIKTDACFNTCVSKGSSPDDQQPAGSRKGH